MLSMFSRGPLEYFPGVSLVAILIRCSATALARVPHLQIPMLQLPGGGQMPMSGLGLCCRPSAHGDAVREAVRDFLVKGGRHLDDAIHYQNAKEVGKGIR